MRGKTAPIIIMWQPVEYEGLSGGRMDWLEAPPVRLAPDLVSAARHSEGGGFRSAMNISLVASRPRSVPVRYHIERGKGGQ